MDPITFQQIMQYGLPLVGLVALTFYLKNRVDKTEANCIDDKTKLVNRLNFKDEQIETKNEKIEQILTTTVQSNTRALERLVESNQGINNTLSDHSKAAATAATAAQVAAIAAQAAAAAAALASAKKEKGD